MIHGQVRARSQRDWQCGRCRHSGSGGCRLHALQHGGFRLSSRFHSCCFAARSPTPPTDLPSLEVSVSMISSTYSRLSLVVIGLFVILNVMYTLFTPPPHIAMYGWLTAIVLIPFTWMLVMERTYRIEVDGTRISVRRRLGLSRFIFDISDITNVDAKIVDSGVGRLSNMTIRTSDGKK